MYSSVGFLNKDVKDILQVSLAQLDRHISIVEVKWAELHLSVTILANTSVKVRHLLRAGQEQQEIYKDCLIAHVPGSGPGRHNSDICGWKWNYKR